MSVREQSFCRALFFGVVAEDLIFPFPQLGDEALGTTHELCAQVRRFADGEVDSAAIDRDGSLEPRYLGRLRELGLFGLSAPKELGGSGLPRLAAARVQSELSAVRR